MDLLNKARGQPGFRGKLIIFKHNQEKLTAYQMLVESAKKAGFEVLLKRTGQTSGILYEHFIEIDDESIVKEFAENNKIAREVLGPKALNVLQETCFSIVLKDHLLGQNVTKADIEEICIDQIIDDMKENTEKQITLKVLQSKIHKYLENYAENSCIYNLVFSNEFNNDERRIIHETAQKFKLKSKSFGKDNIFQLVVSKKLAPWDLVERLLENGDSSPNYQLLRPTKLNTSETTAQIYNPSPNSTSESNLNERSSNSRKRTISETSNDKSQSNKPLPSVAKKSQYQSGVQYDSNLQHSPSISGFEKNNSQNNDSNNGLSNNGYQNNGSQNMCLDNNGLYNNGLQNNGLFNSSYNSNLKNQGLQNNSSSYNIGSYNNTLLNNDLQSSVLHNSLHNNGFSYSSLHTNDFHDNGSNCINAYNDDIHRSGLQTNGSYNCLQNKNTYNYENNHFQNGHSENNHYENYGFREKYATPVNEYGYDKFDSSFQYRAGFEVGYECSQKYSDYGYTIQQYNRQSNLVSKNVRLGFFDFYLLEKVQKQKGCRGKLILFHNTLGNLTPYQMLVESAQKVQLEVHLKRTGETKDNLFEYEIQIGDETILREYAETNKNARDVLGPKALAILQQNCFSIIIKTHLKGRPVTRSDIESTETNPPSSWDLCRSDSKGVKMMRLMGWQGRGLGRYDSERQPPVQLADNLRRFGLSFGKDRSLDDIQARILKYMEAYVLNPCTYNLVFSNEFSTDERKIIHEVSLKLKLKSKSFGKADNWQLVVSKKLSPWELVEHLLASKDSNPNYQLLRPTSMDLYNYL